MLLFFMAEMTASAEACNPENINTHHMSYTVYVCDELARKGAEYAVSWWKKQGQSLTLADGVSDCPDIFPETGKIFIEFNNDEVSKINVEGGTPQASTTRRHEFLGTTVESAKVFLSTELQSRPEDMIVFITHEIGHAVGYAHVNEDCNNHIMHPFLNEMMGGLSFQNF